MKILFDQQTFCMQQYGGISRYFSELAHHISLIPEHQIEIFAPLYINEHLSPSEKITIRGRKVPHISWVGDIAIEAIDSALSLFQTKPRKDVDIFHETYFTLVDSCPVSAKRIITVYDMIHERSPDNHYPWNRTLHAKKKAVQRADHIICISENTRKDLIELLDVPENKTSVVYLGYSLSAKCTKKTYITKKPYLLYVGDRGKHKNFTTLLLAFAHSPRIRGHFSLICFGGGKFNTSEKELMNDLDIAPTEVIQVSGDDGTLAGLYSTSSAFIYPSLYEGFGIPPLEAMSFDCPVICSNTSSLPEVVGDAAEFFNPLEEDSIGCAIERVVTSQDHSAQLVKKGYARVNKFSWKKCAKETLDVYCKVLKN